MHQPEICILTLASRRQFFSDCGLSLGGIALAALMDREARPRHRRRLAHRSVGRARPPHFAPRAKAVIQLFMAGGPSQLELFDHKPKLVDAEWPIDSRVAIPQASGSPLSSPTQSCSAAGAQFAQHGQSGNEISELLPTHRRDGRRTGHPADDEDRRLQPRPGQDDAGHRHAAIRPAEHGLVGHVRSGKRVARPARLRGAEIRPRGTARSALRCGATRSCRAFIRGCHCGTRATRFST